MTDFDHATDQDRARAKMLAEKMGWRRRGTVYTHATRGNYLASSLDGWIDVCDTEGIDWTEDRQECVRDYRLHCPGGACRDCCLNQEVD